MKLGKRQSQSIASILAEGRDEIRSASDQRRRLSSKSRLNETLMFEAPVSAEGMAYAVSLAVKGDSAEHSRDLLTKFDKILYKALSDLLARHGGEKMSPSALQDHLEDHDLESLEDLQRSLILVVESSLNTYAAGVAKLAQHVVLPSSDPEASSDPEE